MRKKVIMRGASGLKKFAFFIYITQSNNKNIENVIKKKFNCKIKNCQIFFVIQNFPFGFCQFNNSYFLFCFNKLIFFSSQDSYVMFQHLFFRPVYRVCIHSKKKQVVHTPCILELLSSSEINKVSVSRSCILLINQSNIVHTTK